MGRAGIPLLTILTAAVLSGCSGGDAQDVPPELEQAAEAAGTVVAFCDAARTNLEAGRPFADLVAAGPGRSEEEIETVLAPLRESNEAMLATAPEEIRPDVEAAAGLAEVKLAAYQASGGDPAKAAEDPAVVAKAQESTEAVTRMQRFMKIRCGIDVD